LHHRSDHGPTDKTNPEIQTGKELQKIQSNAPVNKKTTAQRASAGLDWAQARQINSSRSGSFIK
jgi:hypothetical protein